MSTLFSPYTYTFPKEFFTEFKCSSSLFPHASGSVVAVTPEQTILNGLQVLTDNRVLSVPIINPNRKPIGTFSIRYLIAYLLGRFSRNDFQQDVSSNVHNLLSNKNIKEMLSELGSSMEPTHIVHKTDSLLDAALLMIRSEAPRVLVVDEEEKLSRLITQSRMVNLLATMLDSIPNSEKTLKEINLGFRHVVSVRDDSTAYDAFKLMIEKNVSAVPVVDKDNKLIGNISMSDIKLVGYDTRYFRLLGGPLLEYLNYVYSPLLKYNRIQSQLLKKLQENAGAFPTVCVHPDDKLGDALHLVHLFKVHRIYIVDENNHPVGVLALHDFLRYFVEMSAPGAE